MLLATTKHAAYNITDPLLTKWVCAKRETLTHI